MGKLTELAGVKAEYPWEQKQEQEVLHEMKGQIVEAFRNGHLTSDASAGHTAFCMTVALKQLGLGLEERQSIMSEFAEKNGIHGIGKILKTVEEADTNFLRKDTWAMINNNLKEILNILGWNGLSGLLRMKNSKTLLQSFNNQIMI